MKKIIFTSLIITFCSIFSFAQKSFISVGAGLNTINSISDNISLPDTSDLQMTSLPAFNIAFDYRIKSWFSLGFAFTTQSFTGDIYNYEYTENTVVKHDDISFGINRVNFGIRPVYHYGLNNKIELYTGVRLGLLYSMVSTNTDIPDLNNEDIFKIGIGVKPAYQVFGGFKFRIEENFGFFAEGGYGSPYIGCLGVFLRF